MHLLLTNVESIYVTKGKEKEEEEEERKKGKKRRSCRYVKRLN